MTESVKQVLYGTYLFSSNQNITSVNLNNATFTNGNMSYCFNNCHSLTTVSGISNSTYNMYAAFSNCNVLTSVPTLPDTVIDMGYTFNNCRSLTSVSHIPNHVQNLDYTFNYTNLNAAPNIPNSVTSMWYTFNRCYNLTSIGQLPDKNLTLMYTFAYCNKLTSLPAISNKLNLYYTFSGCTNLTNIQNLPEGMKTLSGTFSGCSKLYNITIPNSVTSMSYTFSGCTNLKTPPVIPNSVTAMSGVFNGCSGLTTYPVIPAHIKSFGAMFSNCTQFTSFYQVPEDTVYMYGIFSGCPNMYGTYTIPNTVEGDIGYAFNNCRNLYGSLTIPENVTNCSTVFQNCINITGVNFYCNDVNSLYYCCNNCTSLQTVTFNCNHIGNTYYAFNNCTALTSVSGTINTGSIGWLCRLRTSLTDCNLVTNTITNASMVFYGCYNLKNCTFEADNITNGYMMFWNCNNLCNDHITINSIHSAQQIFQNCTNMTHFVNLPNATSLTYAYENVCIPSIGPSISVNATNMYSTFRNCSNMVSCGDLSVCNDLTALDYAFYGCNSLSSISNIPENVTSMESTFSSCANLTGNIYINSFKVSNSDFIFSNTSATKNVYIPFTYSNGTFTQTYNSFTSEYDTEGTSDGVYLKPHFMYINMSIPENSTLFVNGDRVTNSQQLTIKEDTDYILIKEGYVPYTKHITYQEGETTASIVDGDLSNQGITLLIVPTQSDTTTELTYLGMTSIANSCTVASGTSVTYKVKKSGYKPEIQTIVLTEDTTITVTLDVSEIPTTPGSRIKNMATVVGTFTDNSGKSYVYAVLDSIYRDMNAPNYLPMKDFDYDEYTGTPPNLPQYDEYMYGAEYMTTNGNIESATHNTDVMLDYYSDYDPYDSEYYHLYPEEIPELDESYYFETIYSVARNAATITLDGMQFESQLPNTYELNQIWQNLSILDNLDPTIIGDDSQSLTNIFNEQVSNLRVWSSTLGEAFYEIELWAVGKRWDNPLELQVLWSSGSSIVVPIFEIPLD